MTEARCENWRRIESAPESIPVLTRINDAFGPRNEAILKRSGRLWFTPDGSFYVYYQPTEWKPAPARQDGGK